MELIQIYFFNNYMYLQLIPAIIGLVYIKKIDVLYRCFVLLLWYSIFNEYFAEFYKITINGTRYNSLWYNIFNVIYFIFLYYLFYKISKSILFRKVIKCIVVLYFISMFCELFVDRKNYLTQTQVIPYLIGGLGILICVFNYLIGIIRENNVVAVHQDLLFWIAIAHFIYYLGFVPFKLGENYFVDYKEYNYLREIKVPVTFLRNLILSIGFICSRQKTQ